METRPPNEPPYPESPDRLERGLRGPVGGVTRIGPRAFALGFFVICALLVAILYGLNRSGPLSRSTNEAYASPPPAQSTNDSHFGQNEPIVASPASATEAPPLVLPPTAVPNLDQQQDAPRATTQPAANPPAAAPPATVDNGAAQQQQADLARQRAENAKNERALLESARKSPILTGSNPTGSDRQNQLAFAGNGDPGAPAQTNFASTNTADVGGAGTGTRGTSPAIVGQRFPLPEETRAPRTTAYLDGPSGQYAVQPANVVLPQGGNPKDFLQAQRFAPISPFEIVASSVIPAALITGIDSELPGLVSAQVRENVYDSKTGRYLLIPKGARLIGLYDSQTQFGQSRLLVAWQRLIFPDTTSIDLLNMSGADSQGGAGVSGIVDNHYGRIFGAALLTSVLAAGASLASPQNSNLLQNPSAGQTISQSIGQQISQVGTQIVQKSLNIPPVVHVARGYPFLVVVDRDIVLPGVYGVR